MCTPIPLLRLASALFAALGLAWVLALTALTAVGYYPSGGGGRALPVTAEHVSALAIGLGVLLLHRARRSLAPTSALPRSLPVIAAGLMLCLATAALLVPHACGDADAAPATWWSAWHHFAVMALQIAVAIVGARRRPGSRGGVHSLARLR